MLVLEELLVEMDVLLLVELPEMLLVVTVDRLGVRFIVEIVM